MRTCHTPHPAAARPAVKAAAKASGKSVTTTAGSGGHALIDAEALVGVECDLLVPAALENMIHEGNCASVKARASCDSTCIASIATYRCPTRCR